MSPDEHLGNWSQLLSWNVTFGRDRFDLPRARDSFLASMKLQCKTLETRHISSEEEDLIYEWWLSRCYDRPAQHMLTRRIAGRIGTHTISYTLRNRPLASEQRDHWLEQLRTLELSSAALPSSQPTDFEAAQLEVWTGDYASAFSRLEPLARRGSSQAQELLGRLLVEGWGKERDYPKARKWFEAARERGSARGTYSLARLFDEGLGTERDLGRAIALYTEAAEQGYAAAHHHYEAAARGGDPLAQFHLGRIYSTGYGVQRSDELSDVWLIRAAMQGEEQARALYRERQLQTRSPSKTSTAVNGRVR